MLRHQALAEHEGRIPTMELSPESTEKLERARRMTATAITEVAEAKYRLELVRKTRYERPEVIQDAATSYREKERSMKEMINREIAIITEVALAQVNDPPRD
jgi:hypothetical protein